MSTPAYSNANLVIYGYHVALLPFSEKHVAKRQEWMESKDNWAPYLKAPTSYDAERSRWTSLCKMKTSAAFMIADVEKLLDLGETENGSLVGEATLVVDEDQCGVLEFLLTETSVRRKKFMSESMFLVLYYASTVMGIQRVVVHPGSTSQNRLLFCSRDDARDIASNLPLPPRRPSEDGAKDTPPVRRKSSSAKVGPASEGNRQTDYLSKLTQHLTAKDPGSHWPRELDFALTGDNTLELPLSKEVASKLKARVKHARLIKYSSMQPDSRLRCSANVRVNGPDLCFIPYRREHVPKVCKLMQLHDMYICFGVNPPSLEQEIQAQIDMEHDEDCYSFAVCTQDDPSIPDSPLTIVGRAHIVRQGRTALIFSAIGVQDIELRAKYAKIALVMTMHTAFSIMLLDEVRVKNAVLIPPSHSDSKQYRIVTSFKPVEGTDMLSLSLREPVVQRALIMIGSPFSFVAFDRHDAKYVDSSAV